MVSQKHAVNPRVVVLTLKEAPEPVDHSITELIDIRRREIQEEYVRDQKYLTAARRELSRRLLKHEGTISDAQEEELKKLGLTPIVVAKIIMAMAEALDIPRAELVQPLAAEFFKNEAVYSVMEDLSKEVCLHAHHFMAAHNVQEHFERRDSRKEELSSRHPE